jgi:DNA-binding transcriptional LysR family regulator
MSLSLRDVDYFLEVARLGQLTGASSSLGVTSAALSKAIRRLEDELGLRLFERSGKGMPLTPFGESFVRRAHMLQSEHHDALRFAGEVRAGRAGLLRVGTTVAVFDTLITLALADLQPRRPGMRVTLTVAGSDEVLELTRRGSVDLCVVPIYEQLPHGLAQVLVGADALVAVARDGHAIHRQRRCTLEKVAALPWVVPISPSAARTRLELAFTKAGTKPPEATIELDSGLSTALPLVRATDLLAFVPQSYLRLPGAKGVKKIDMTELRVHRTIGLFFREDVHRSPLMTEFMQVLEEIGKRLDQAKHPSREG